MSTRKIIGKKIYDLYFRILYEGERTFFYKKCGYNIHFQQLLNICVNHFTQNSTSRFIQGIRIYIYTFIDILQQ